MEVPHYRLSNALIFDFGAQAAELARPQFIKLEDLLFPLSIADVLIWCHGYVMIHGYFAICLLLNLYAIWLFVFDLS